MKNPLIYCKLAHFRNLVAVRPVREIPVNCKDGTGHRVRIL